MNALPHNRSSSSFAEFILPTHTFDTAPADIEVLIVPGGLGNRQPAAIPTVDFIRKVYPSLRYLITVCTGSGLAARAGVLDGKKATTNKWAFGETSKLGPKTQYVYLSFTFKPLQPCTIVMTFFLAGSLMQDGSSMGISGQVQALAPV